MRPLSILDLAPVAEGSSPADALRHSLDLAQHAERWGYTRFWLAEHHNMAGIASAATAVVIGYVAGGTRTIRVGAGGIMLPNHAPLVVAEQFGTLETLYPGRIDLGLGRAPGTDQLTSRALRRDHTSADTFPQDVLELQAYFEPLQPGQKVQAVPGTGLRVPLWILGSSLFGAQLAGMLGLPFAFASHFAPDALMQALQVYRSTFQPSRQLERPYAMVGVNVIAAGTDEEARHLFTSLQQRFTDMVRGTRGLLKPPIPDIEAYWSAQEKVHASRMLACSFVGSAETLRGGLARFVQDTGLMNSSSPRRSTTTQHACARTTCSPTPLQSKLLGSGLQLSSRTQVVLPPLLAVTCRSTGELRTVPRNGAPVPSARSSRSPPRSASSTSPNVAWVFR